MREREKKKALAHPFGATCASLNRATHPSSMLATREGSWPRNRPLSPALGPGNPCFALAKCENGYIIRALPSLEREMWQVTQDSPRIFAFVFRRTKDFERRRWRPLARTIGRCTPRAEGGIRPPLGPCIRARNSSRTTIRVLVRRPAVRQFVVPHQHQPASHICTYALRTCGGSEIETGQPWRVCTFLDTRQSAERARLFRSRVDHCQP